MKIRTVFAAFLATFVPTAAWADHAQVAIVTDGPASEKVADAITASLPDGWSAADRATFAAALKADGQTAPVGAALRKPADKAALITHARHAAAAGNDDAVLIVSVTKTPKGRRVSLVLVDASKDAPLVDKQVVLPTNPNAADRDKLKAAISPGLQNVSVASAAPATVTSKEEATKDKPADKKEKEKDKVADKDRPNEKETKEPEKEAPADTNENRRIPGNATRAFLDLSVGFDLASRHFSFHDGLSNNLRTYDVDAAPMLSFAGGVYPLANMNSPIDVGVIGGFKMGLSLQSATRNGTPVNTSWTRIDAGVRGRLRLAKGPRPAVIGITAAYGRESFTFKDAAGISNDLPSSTYGFIRTGLDTRIPIGPVALVASFDYLITLASGDVGDRFKDTRVAGVEGELGVVLPFAHYLEVRLTGTYTRFFYSFLPVPGDTYIAGGALDQIFRGQLAVAFLY